MRTLKIIVKNLFHDPEFKLQIENYKKNIIDLEENDGEKYICSNEEKKIFQMKMFKLLNNIWEKNYRWKNNPIIALKRCKIHVIFNLVLMKKTSKLNSRIFNIVKETLNLKEYIESLELSFKVSINFNKINYFKFSN